MVDLLGNPDTCPQAQSIFELALARKMISDMEVGADLLSLQVIWKLHTFITPSGKNNTLIKKLLHLRGPYGTCPQTQSIFELALARKMISDMEVGQSSSNEPCWLFT